MKKDIHPEYKKMKIKCVCGNEIETGSVCEDITVEICNNCHPFFTGTQKSWTQKDASKDSKKIRTEKIVRLISGLKKAVLMTAFFVFI